MKFNNFMKAEVLKTLFSLDNHKLHNLESIAFYF